MADPNFRLKKGKLIDVQKGFTDSFNFAYENLNGLRGGQGVAIDKSVDGAWMIMLHETPSLSGEEQSGGVSEAVYDVVAGRKWNRDGLSVQYTDDRAEKFIPFDTAVSDITRISSNYNGDKLSVDFTDGSSKQVDMYITLSGNVNTNTIKVIVGSNNVIQIGAYYI